MRTVRMGIIALCLAGLCACKGDEKMAIQQFPFDESYVWTFPWSTAVNGGHAAVDMAGNEWSRIWSINFPLQVMFEMAVNGKYILFLGLKEWTQISTDDTPSRINLLCYNIHDGKLEFEHEWESHGRDRIYPISGRKEALLLLDEKLHIVNLETGDFRELKGAPMQGEFGEATQVSADAMVVTMYEADPLDLTRPAKVWLYAMNLTTDEVTALSNLNPASWVINSAGDGNFFYFEELSSIACINLESGNRLWRASLPITVDPEVPDSYLSSYIDITTYGDRVYVPLKTGLQVFDANTGELLNNLRNLPTGILHLVVDEDHVVWSLWPEERAFHVINLETGDVANEYGTDTPYASRDGVVIRITADTAVNVYDGIGGELVKSFNMRPDFGAFLIDSGGGMVILEPDSKLTRYK